MAGTWTNTLSVPRINLRNNTINGTPTPLKLNDAKFRHIYKDIAESPLVSGTDADYGKKLPWLSFHKKSDDLLQVRLVTTIGYIQDTSTGAYHAFTISGFPLLLQGPASQFANAGNITSDHWENDWTFYKQNVTDFSGNFYTSMGNNDNWLNNDTIEAPKVISDMKNRKNLLVLDLSSNSADTDSLGNDIPNFVLKDSAGTSQYKFTSSTMEKVNRKERPPYLVIRLDEGYEETTYSGVYQAGGSSIATRKKGFITSNPNFWQNIGSSNPQLYVFNYVYYGYVISPYEFMANFTTDFLRGALAPVTVGGTPESYFLHEDGIEHIQVNSEFFSPTHELKTGWSDRGSNHFFINTPYYYDIHLCPQTLNHDINGADIITPSTAWSIRNNVITDVSFVNLGSSPDIPVAIAPYNIEQLFWFSLHSFRHTEYSPPNLNPNITKKLYLGNYLNVNEVEALNQQDSSGNYIYSNKNADYMPKKTSTSFYPCGCIVTDYHPLDGGGTTYEQEKGTRNLVMPRKTSTQYFKIDHHDSTEYNKYSFNWNDPTKTWNEIGGSGIADATSYVDLSNCEVLEWRNLIEFDANTILNLQIDISGAANTVEPKKRKITFVTSDNPKTDMWKNNVQLQNNDVVSRDTNIRSIKNIEGEKFKITWGDNSSSTSIIAANTSKYAYVIDIATGIQTVRGVDDIRWDLALKSGAPAGSSTDSFLPPSASNYSFDSSANGVYTLSGDPNMRSLGMGASWNVTVYKIGADSSNDWGSNVSDLQYSAIENRINFALDSEETPITININRRTDIQPFGYLNFLGLTSSEFLGGINARVLNSNSNLILSQVFKRRNVETISLRRAITANPYFTNEASSNDSYWIDNDVKKIFYNPNLFYGHTNFKHSNIYGAAVSTFSDSQTDIFFKNGVQVPPTWRTGDHKNDGKEITTFPQLGYIRPSGIELYITSLTGKFDLNNRVLDGPINEEDEPPTVELNDKITLTEAQFGIVNQKFNCLNFYNIMHTMSQKNLFISDHWEWDIFLNDMVSPPSVYTGDVPVTIVMPDKSINKRYNVYDFKATNVPSSIYSSGVHTPDKTFENQSLISMIVEVSTISLNVSHILLNTWAGHKTVENTFPIVGLSSFPNEQGEYYPIYGTPKLQIQGGNSITPTISDSPVYLSINPEGHFNFATDSTPGVISADDRSKRPKDIPEAEGNIIDFNSSSFTSGDGTTTTSPSGGWFTQPFSQDNSAIGNQIGTSNNGIFTRKILVSSTFNTNTLLYDNVFMNTYNTIDISTNALANSPSNITTTFNGKFTQEEQDFPLELFFTYPFTLNDNIQKPDKLATLYDNSDGNSSGSVTFDNYKGNKRFSSLYALEIFGSPYAYNNENFYTPGTNTSNYYVGFIGDPNPTTAGLPASKGRKIFPNTVIVNCVELPPPKQVNNFNDMLAGDNTFTRIVWKGYNFNYSPDGPRDQNGNSGNIIWKIERFQTQLEIRKVVFQGTITPIGGENDDGYNLSTYEFKDTDIRIYDKYTYTVSGIYRYQFKRTRTDTNLYTLELDIGSFTTDEFIICKNNKFPFGRYNTGATNLKLFRPLLINKSGGQVDEFGRPSAGGTCPPNTFAGSTRISSSQNIYANTSNQVTKKGTYVLLSKQQYRPFR